jgi:hypothetical protein
MSKITEKISLEYLTDELIYHLSKKNVLTEYRDLNLKKSRTKEDEITSYYPYPGGIFDKDIFGSLFSDQCNCGSTRGVGETCIYCTSTILDIKSAYNRYARIDLTFYYCSPDSKYKNLINWLKNTFSWEFKITGSWSWIAPKLNEKVLEVCQFNYDKSSGKITVTDNITDFYECSFEGLLAILLKHFPAEAKTFKTYINKSILVCPIIIRPIKILKVDGKIKVKVHEISAIYRNIIYMIHKFYRLYLPDMKTESDKALFTGIIRRYLSRVTSLLTRLFNTSKENFARVMQSKRLPNSGRSIIVPAPDLRADEVYIPRHLMYEACRDEFIGYLAKYYDMTKDEAKVIYKIDANEPHIQELFEKYIEGDGEDDKGKYVILNRNPTLYELNMMCCKVRLTNNYAIGIPNDLCAPFGGDYDGDSFAFYCVPKRMNDKVNEAMSSRNIIYYNKNLNPLFLPTHEVLNGLINATKVNAENDEFLKKNFTLDEAIELKKTNRDFKYQTLCKIDGKQTTLSRALLSEYFKFDINSKITFKETLNSFNIIPLYLNLSSYPDRLDCIKKIQDLSLLITTQMGMTSPSLSDLYIDIDYDFLLKIREVESNDKLSEKEREIKVRELYIEFVQREEARFKKEKPKVEIHISESARSKMHQLLAVSLPQLNVGPDKKISVSGSTLLEFQSPREYEQHAIENRATQDIKQASVPGSGNFTRQMVYLASPYFYSSEEDTKNRGILIKERNAIGRTRVDGTIVDRVESDDLIRVRSIITSSTKDENKITSDMISNLIKYKDGTHIGIKMITTLTEGTTQSGLSLKHGSSLYSYENLSKLRAPEDVKLINDNKWILLESKSKQYKYPKPDNFIISWSENNLYNKDDVVGVALHPITPSYKSSALITLCTARKLTPKKKFAHNEILISECYAYEDAVITYNISEDKKAGETMLKFGGNSYIYNPNALYFLPEGTKVKKRDRICTGLLYMKGLTEKITDYEDAFYFFRNQFDELMEINAELIEFLYVLIAKEKKNKVIIDNVINRINESESFYTRIAFENAKKVFEEIGPEGLTFKGDTLTNIILSLLTKNNIEGD